MPYADNTSSQVSPCCNRQAARHSTFYPGNHDLVRLTQTLRGRSRPLADRRSLEPQRQQSARQRTIIAAGQSSVAPKHAYGPFGFNTDSSCTRRSARTRADMRLVAFVTEAAPIEKI
jgi:hypothetical protein